MSKDILAGYDGTCQDYHQAITEGLIEKSVPYDAYVLMCSREYIGDQNEESVYLETSRGQQMVGSVMSNDPDKRRKGKKFWLTGK